MLLHKPFIIRVIRIQLNPVIGFLWSEEVVKFWRIKFEIPHSEYIINIILLD